MSAKLLYSLSDENPDLQKQFGCINRMLQVFHRQSLPGPKIAGSRQNGLRPGQTNDLGRETSSYRHKSPERNLKKGTKEQHRVSTESSSRPSFSSSPRSSSFSSADISTIWQFEQPVFTQREFRQAPKPELPNSKHNSAMLLSQHSKSANSSVYVLKESFRAPKTSPRLSYEATEPRNGQKSVLKLRELPRLSLDSREISSRNSSCSSGDINRKQEPGSHRRSTSSIVAKLMGLEVPADSTPPDNNQNAHVKSSQAFEQDFFSRSTIITDDSKKIRFCDTPRPFTREAASPRSRNADSTKTISAAPKFPMEPGPWKQLDGAKNQRSTLKTQTKSQSSNLSVFGEIQKRLTQLEFNETGKDLRALRQILETMEKTQQRLRSKNDNVLGSASSLETNSPKNFRSSIAVFKPTRISERAGDSAADLNPNDRLSHLHRIQTGKKNTHSQTDMAGKQTAKDNTTSSRPILSNKSSGKIYTMKGDITKSGKSQDSANHRLQQKRPGLEKQSSKVQRQQKVSISPRRNPRRKPPNLQQNDEQSSDINSDLRNLNFETHAGSLRSDSNIISASNADAEVTNRFRVDKNWDIYKQDTPKHKNRDLGLSRHGPVKVTSEQPSPVSVLDAAFHGDESPSPVRKINPAFKEDDCLSYEEAESIYLETTDEFFADEDAMTCDARNPNHKYISEILLASGLLKDLEFSMIKIQLSQSRLPINDDHFFVLERSKTGDKVKRKLVFDSVNEILARKFLSEVCSPHVDKRKRTQKILQTLCLEIDRIQANNSSCSLDDKEDITWEDLRHRGMSSSGFQTAAAGLVLDIERSIFKDLINEVGSCEATVRRQLSAN